MTSNTTAQSPTLTTPTPSIPTTPSAPTTDAGAQWAQRAASFSALVDGVGDWDAPTPCEGWSARDVVHHVIETERGFLVQRGLVPADGGDAVNDPAVAWHAHLATVGDIANTPDVLGREYDGFFGRTTIGATLADFYGWDLVIHGWDLARASDQPWSLSDEQAAAMMQTADGWGEALYSEGICAPAVPIAADAPLSEQLLARLGRDPEWSR